VTPKERARPIGVGDALPAVELRRATGDAVELGAFLDRMLLAIALRYYG